MFNNVTPRHQQTILILQGPNRRSYSSLCCLEGVPLTSDLRGILAGRKTKRPLPQMAIGGLNRLKGEEQPTSEADEVASAC